jgi:RNA polymerase sigma factor (sigma-70 family)
VPSPFDTLVDHGPCRGCPQHRTTGSGCAIVEDGAQVPLDAFLAREPCFLKQDLRRFCERYVSQRPRLLHDAGDLAHETITRLLTDARIRAGGFAKNLHSFLGYLRQVAVRCAITAERHERGRLRCGNCIHFGAWSGVCLAAGHFWTHRAVDIEQDPRRLSPECRSFETRKDDRAMTEEILIRASADPDPARERAEACEAVHAALRELAVQHPRAALVLRALFLDGKRYEDLAGLGYSVRTLKRDRALGLEILRHKLRPFFAESVSRRVVAGRFREQENA